MRKPVSFVDSLFASIPLSPLILLPGLAFRRRRVLGWPFSFPLCSVCNNSDFFLSGPLDIRGKLATPSPADGELMARHVDRALLTFPFSL